MTAARASKKAAKFKAKKYYLDLVNEPTDKELWNRFARLDEMEEAHVKWREGLAVSSAAASRQERRTQHKIDPSSPNATWTSRRDPENGKKHKRAAKKAEKKAETKEREHVNADRNALGLEYAATKREKWERLEYWEQKAVKKGKSLAGRKGRDNRKEEWMMHGEIVW